MKKSLKTKVIDLIRENIKLAENSKYSFNGRILYNGFPIYKIVFDSDEHVSLLNDLLLTPKGSIGVSLWQYGNGFEIDSNTSTYQLNKVAERIMADYKRIKELLEEIK